MPISLFNYILNELDACNQKYNLYLQGGEFFLWNELNEKIIHKLNSLSNCNTIGIQTNGVLLSKYLPLIKMFKGFISITIDGPEVIHNFQRNHLSQILKNIQLLRTNNISPGILTILTKYTIDNISPKKFVDYFYKNKLSFRLNCCSRYGIYKGKLIPSPEQAAIYFFRCFEEWVNIGDINFSISPLNEIVRSFLTKSEKINNCTFSNICPQIITFLPNGNVYPCDNFVGTKWRLGNIKKQKISEILNNQLYKRFERINDILKVSQKKCFSCRYKKLCKGGCLKILSEKNDFNCIFNTILFSKIENFLIEKGKKIYLS